MYDSNKQYHLVELTLQSDLGETFEWEIVYRLLLYIRSAYDNGSLLRYTCHDGRVLSIKAVTELDTPENRKAFAADFHNRVSHFEQAKEEFNLPDWQR